MDLPLRLVPASAMEGPRMTEGPYENQRSESPGRRASDQLPQPPRNDWRDLKFITTVLLFLITIGTLFWNRAGKEREIDVFVSQSADKQKEVLEALKGIDTKLQAMALANNTLKNEQDFQKREMVTALATMNEKMAELTNRIDTVEKAYQFNINHRLTYIEAKTGVKAPPPKE